MKDVSLCGDKLNVFSDSICKFRNREKDLDEVLQSLTVYSNVSKGVLAKSKDLIAAFKTNDLNKICLEVITSLIFTFEARPLLIMPSSKLNVLLAYLYDIHAFSW